METAMEILEELQRRSDALTDTVEYVISSGNSVTLYKEAMPTLVIVEYSKYQTMLELLQELGGGKEDE